MAAAAVNVKRAAGHINDGVRDGARQQRVGVDRFRERCPQKESAFRLRPRHEAAEFPAQGRFHRRALALVMLPQRRQTRVEHAALPHLVHQPLIEPAGAQVRRLLGQLEFGGERRRRGDPRDAEPGATVFEKLLRYTTRPSASSALIGRVSAALATSSKCSAPYGSSSTIRTSRRAAHSSSAPAFGLADQQAGRILEIRDRVEERDSPACGALAQRDASRSSISMPSASC